MEYTQAGGSMYHKSKEDRIFEILTKEERSLCGDRNCKNHIGIPSHRLKDISKEIAKQ